MPVEIVYPVVGASFLAICFLATEILVQTHRKKARD